MCSHLSCNGSCGSYRQRNTALRRRNSRRQNSQYASSDNSSWGLGISAPPPSPSSPIGLSITSLNWEDAGANPPLTSSTRNLPARPTFAEQMEEVHRSFALLRSTSNSKDAEVGQSAQAAEETKVKTEQRNFSLPQNQGSTRSLLQGNYTLLGPQDQREWPLGTEAQEVRRRSLFDNLVFCSYTPEQALEIVREQIAGGRI